MAPFSRTVHTPSRLALHDRRAHDDRPASPARVADGAQTLRSLRGVDSGRRPRLQTAAGAAAQSDASRPLCSFAWTPGPFFVGGPPHQNLEREVLFHIVGHRHDTQTIMPSLAMSLDHFQNRMLRGRDTERAPKNMRRPRDSFAGRARAVGRSIVHAAVFLPLVARPSSLVLLGVCMQLAI